MNAPTPKPSLHHTDTVELIDIAPVYRPAATTTSTDWVAIVKIHHAPGQVIGELYTYAVYDVQANGRCHGGEYFVPECFVDERSTRLHALDDFMRRTRGRSPLSTPAVYA